MLIVIDNYDSFTYNLVQYFGELGAEIQVFRNDKITVEQLTALNPSHLCISPGPGNPDDGGVSNDVLTQLSQTIPTLGVCLGHQCTGHVYGGVVSRAPYLMHGKISAVHHNNKGLFAGLPNPFNATRYHSLIVEKPIPETLEITAETEDGLIMGLRHKTYPIVGVQFHPESILTEHGHEMLANFLKM